MTISMHPPASHRCQIYGDTSERCINTGTHWVPWGKCHLHTVHDAEGESCEAEFFSWECDGPHRFGEAATAFVSHEKEAA
jgi:hypothetical protein